MTAPEDPQEAQTPGRFWIEDGTAVPGVLVAGQHSASIVTERPIRESRSVTITETETSRSLELSLDPQETVADTVPVHVMGALDDGRAVTLIDAAIDAREVSFRQAHTSAMLILGAHLARSDSTIPAARVSIPNPRAWLGLADSSTPVAINLGDVEGHLRSYTEDQRLWVELTLTTGLALREWERRFWWRCITLLNLWTEQSLQPELVQFQVSEGEPWADLRVWRSGPAKPMSTHESLLDPRLLTLDNVAQALVRFEHWAPIQDIASKHMQYEVTLELAVLSYASALEGLHRRCYDNSKPFPELSNRLTRDVAKAAAQAAVVATAAAGALPGEEDEARQRFVEAFQHFNELTYADRLRELVAPVHAIAPGLLGEDREDWIKAIRSARNAEAHRLLPSSQASHNAHIDEYYQLATSADWALRLIVLERLGVEPGTLHHRLKRHRRFLYALANMDRCDYSWPGSRLDTFRSSNFSAAGSPD